MHYAVYHAASTPLACVRACIVTLAGGGPGERRKISAGLNRKSPALI